MLVMFRRNSSKKMAVGRVNNNNKNKYTPAHKAVSTTKFKSKLALALSNRDCQNDNVGRNDGVGSRQPLKRGDYHLLEEVVANNGLPLTVTLKQFVNEKNIHNKQQQQDETPPNPSRINGVATIQAYRKITTLHCQSTNDGSEVDLPINDGNVSVNFLSIDNTAVYKTLGEIRYKRRDHNINWFTATRRFVVADNNKTSTTSFFNVGQIFSFAPQSLLSSFKRDRNVRGVTVLAYPSSKRYYLPLDSEGDFKKCDAPTVRQTFELSEFSKSENFPCFISVVNQEEEETVTKQPASVRNLFVKGKSEQRIVYVSRRLRGSLQIHSFPIYKNLYAKMTPTRATVDKLDSSELKLVLRSFEVGCKRDEHGYCIKTYNEIGIIRLLEEIFMELNHNKEGTYTRLSSSCKNLDSKSIEKRVIKTYLRNSTTNGGCGEGRRRGRAQSPHRYLQSVDGQQLLDEQLYDDVMVADGSTRHQHDYVEEENDKNKTSSKITANDKRTRELVVEFDDGGYVIIPFAGSSPKISFDKNLTMKHSDNIAYNYHSSFDDGDCEEDSGTTKSDDEEHYYDRTCDFADDAENNHGDDASEYDTMYDLTCDQHVYTYISSERLDKIVDGKTSKTARLSTENPEHLDYERNSKEPRTSMQSPPLPAERYSVIYDYSHMGHFSIPASLSRSHIREMSIDEVTDMLKVNLMKHHAPLFKQYHLDGEALEKLTEKDLIEMNLTKFEARKLCCFMDGWRPKEGQLEDHASWLSKLAKDWSVNDVTKYLQHINMIGFQRFTARHNIDGFLLKQILSDEVMESLTLEHSLVLKQTDIIRLRNYVLDDEKPRFKYFT